MSLSLSHPIIERVVFLTYPIISFGVSWDNPFGLRL